MKKGIIEDSKKLLISLYEDYITRYKEWNNNNLPKISGLRGNSLKMAMNYLKDSECIKFVWVLGNSYGMQDFLPFRNITPKGIQIIETKSRFREFFGNIKGFKER